MHELGPEEHGRGERDWQSPLETPYVLHTLATGPGITAQESSGAEDEEIWHLPSVSAEPYGDAPAAEPVVAGEEVQARSTSEFFMGDPVAATLRDITLEGLRSYEEYLMGDEESLGKILDVNRQLREHGIEPNMHVIDPEDPDIEAKKQRLLSDPQHGAEWVSGQFLSQLEGSAAFKQLNLHAAAEHDKVAEVEGPALIDLRAAPRSVIDPVINLASIGILRGFFGANNE